MLIQKGYVSQHVTQSPFYSLSLFELPATILLSIHLSTWKRVKGFQIGSTESSQVAVDIDSGAVHNRLRPKIQLVYNI